MSQISVLGTGNMRAALIRALVNGGTSVTIWNRTRAFARWQNPPESARRAP